MNRQAQTVLFACAVAALMWIIIARITGPSDFWEKNQPNTISYTTDIILHGRWILPTEVGGRSATKPPLYNWIAVPFVRVFGTTNETAHRLPSILAFIGCFVLLIIIGRRMNAPAVGYIAALAFILNPAMYKLGLLARPDPPLTFFLILGWMVATILIINSRSAQSMSNRLPLQLTFWLAVALAALTKGPPALLLILYALIAPRIINGSWRETRVFVWHWGVAVGVAPFAAWLCASYAIDPDHVVNQLWGEEVAGRVTGTGEEGSRLGPIGFLYGLGHMPFYYVTRFLPWSVISILAMIELRRDRNREEKFADGEARLWMIASTIFLLITIIFFTLSTGKRAAYIAPAYGPGAILAAWWIIWFFTKRLTANSREPEARGPLVAWIIAVATAIMLGALTTYDLRDSKAPTPRFGDAIIAFADESVAILKRESATAKRDPILLWQFDHLLTRAMLGGPFVDVEAARRHLETGQSVWVIAPGDAQDPSALLVLFAALDPAMNLRAEPTLTSADLPAAAGWPGIVTLWQFSSSPVAP